MPQRNFASIQVILTQPYAFGANEIRSHSELLSISLSSMVTDFTIDKSHKSIPKLTINLYDRDDLIYNNFGFLDRLYICIFMNWDTPNPPERDDLSEYTLIGSFIIMETKLDLKYGEHAYYTLTAYGEEIILCESESWASFVNMTDAQIVKHIALTEPLVIESMKKSEAIELLSVDGYVDTSLDAIAELPDRIARKYPFQTGFISDSYFNNVDPAVFIQNQLDMGGYTGALNEAIEQEEGAVSSEEVIFTEGESHDGSDYELVKRLAQRNGFEFFVKPSFPPRGHFVFGPLELATPEYLNSGLSYDLLNDKFVDIAFGLESTEGVTRPYSGHLILDFDKGHIDGMTINTFSYGGNPKIVVNGVNVDEQRVDTALYDDIDDDVTVEIEEKQDARNFEEKELVTVKNGVVSFAPQVNTMINNIDFEGGRPIINFRVNNHNAHHVGYIVDMIRRQHIYKFEVSFSPIIGLPGLEPRSTIKLIGTALKDMAGWYYVTEVRDKWDKGKHTQDITAVKYYTLASEYDKENQTISTLSELVESMTLENAIMPLTYEQALARRRNRRTEENTYQGSNNPVEESRGLIDGVRVVGYDN